MSLDLIFDSEHIWHPYSSTTSPTPVFPVESANGVKIKLESGTELIDGMSSWWSAIHGYNHPVITKAIKEQAEKLAHIMFGGLTHEPAITLCKKLVEITPKNLTQVFLSDSGSVSVEVALKMAIQYWYNKGEKSKKRFLTVKRGYHGDTFGAMSVSDSENGMHHLFSNSLQKQFSAPAPQSSFYENFVESDISELKKIAEEQNCKIAAVIIEPVVQGAGGMRFYSPKYLDELRKICDDNNLLLIFDEIATGFGRTGKLFATNHTNIAPDIMTLGKAITGGTMTLAATITTKSVSDTVSLNGSVLMHGPTFMANPLACAVANSSIDLLLSSKWQDRVTQIEKSLTENLTPLKKLDIVKDVRVLGAIGVVELNDTVDMETIQPRFVDAGVWIRPFGNLVYTMPPFIISKEELHFLCSAICKVVKGI
jgi:adenosylmethionine-8-amino-7-oxononanoate aminotransferase